MAFWLLTTDPAAHVFTALLGGAAWLAAAPLLAFGDGGSTTANGHYLGGGIYGHLRRADEQEAAEMAKLLEEHRP